MSSAERAERALRSHAPLAEGAMSPGVSVAVPFGFLGSPVTSPVGVDFLSLHRGEQPTTEPTTPHRHAMTIDSTDTNRRIPRDQVPLERPPDSTDDDSEFRFDVVLNVAVEGGRVGDREQALADHPTRETAADGVRAALPGAVAG